MISKLEQHQQTHTYADTSFVSSPENAVSLIYFEIRRMKFSNTLLAVRYRNGNQIWLSMIKPLHSIMYESWVYNKRKRQCNNFLWRTVCKPLRSTFLHSHYHGNRNEILNFGCDIKQRQFMERKEEWFKSKK